MNVLVWFKRDLRIEDHPALARAAGLGRVLPLYIVEPALWSQDDSAARHWAHIAETLEGLRHDLAGIGAPLVVRVGDAATVLERLARAHRIGWMISHQEIGNAFTFSRDRQVAAWARAKGIRWEELPQTGVCRGRRPADWGARRDAFMSAPEVPIPALTAVPGVEPGVIPSARSLRLADDPCPHRQPGGAATARLMLEGFLTRRGQDYRRAMASPLTAERGCSRLSPYLAVGTISARSVVQATAAQAATRPGPGWGASLSSFQSRMAWRDHFTQKLESEPGYEFRPLHPAAARHDHDAARMAAFVAGETGLPFVDACLRYLRATGWLNFRARAMLVTTAVHLMGLDWRAVGLHLARRFTDYDPGIHWPQVQMQAGLTAVNLPRIYNPVKQGLDQDPLGRFTRRWVPELAGVPDLHLQTPWRWPEAGRLLGRRYPEPVIDPTTALREGRAALATARQGAQYHQTRTDILNRHTSRLERARSQSAALLVSPPRRVAPGGQLSLDL